MADHIERMRFLNTIQTWQFGGEAGLPEELEERLKEDRAAHDKCIEFMNRCLDTHWKIWERVNSADQALTDYKDVLTTGSGLGVSDLQEVLDALRTAPTFHASANILNDRRPYWLDGNFSEYGRDIVAPTGFVNYMEAVDERAEEFKEVADGILKDLAQISASVEEKRWDAVQEFSGSLKEKIERAKFVLWYVGNEEAFKNSAVLGLDMPAELDGTRRELAVKAFSDMGERDKLSSLLGKAESYAGLVSKIDAIKSSAELMVDLQTKGELDEVEAGALAAIHYACGYLPLLGSVYQGSIEWLVTFLPQWRAIFAEKERMATDVVGVLKERERRRSARQ